MKLFDCLHYLFKSLAQNYLIYRIQNRQDCKMLRIEGEILRNVHSVEKGLCLEDVRMGFGLAKIMEAFSLVEEYINEDGFDYNQTIVTMFADAVDSYLLFHDEHNYSDENVEQIRAKSMILNEKLKLNFCEKGGFNIIQRCNYTESEKNTFSKIIRNRHSVREFTSSPVDTNLLRNSIEMAMHCPSACNRQGFRVYIVDHTKFDKLQGWFDGVGGFAHKLDKIILITGKLSVYRKEEMYQYAISSTVFASYLTLSLEVNNIGCCFIQRELTPTFTWDRIAQSLNIPKDELTICALGIGNLKETYKVPISNRLSYEEIVKIV